MTAKTAARRSARRQYPLEPSRQVFDQIARHTLELRSRWPQSVEDFAAVAFQAARCLEDALIERGVSLSAPALCVVAFEDNRPVAAIDIPRLEQEAGWRPSRILGPLHSLELFGEGGVVLVITEGVASLNPSPNMRGLVAAFLSNARITGRTVHDVVMRGRCGHYLSLAEIGLLEKLGRP
jgi:hypothetical protein